MRSMILVAAVLVSGLAGGLLLYLAEKYVAEAAADSKTPLGGEDTACGNDTGGADDGCENEEGAFTSLSVTKRAVLIGCMIVCSGTIAAFREHFYDDTVLETANLLLLCSVLWVCAWTDLRAKLILNSVLAYGLLLRCALVGVELIVLPGDVPLDLLRSVIAAVMLLVAAILCRLAVPKAVGFGDVKLLMLMGFFLGTDRVWGSIFLTMVVSFFYSLTLLITKRATLKTEIPYAPFLFLGTVAAGILLGY